MSYLNMTGYINESSWEQANRYLVRKMLICFFHEKVIYPEMYPIISRQSPTG